MRLCYRVIFWFKRCFWFPDGEGSAYWTAALPTMQRIRMAWKLPGWDRARVKGMRRLYTQLSSHNSTPGGFCLCRRALILENPK